MQPNITGETLKSVLESLLNPEALEAHPWVQGYFVQAYLSRRAEAEALFVERRLTFL